MENFGNGNENIENKNKFLWNFSFAICQLCYYYI